MEHVFKFGGFRSRRLLHSSLPSPCPPKDLSPLKLSSHVLGRTWVRPKPPPAPLGEGGVRGRGTNWEPWWAVRDACRAPRLSVSPSKLVSTVRFRPEPRVKVKVRVRTIYLLSNTLKFREPTSEDLLAVDPCSKSIVGGSSLSKSDKVGERP